MRLTAACLVLPVGVTRLVCPPRRRGRPADGGVNQGSDYSDEERIFMVAMDRYKRVRARPYPSCTEVLTVLLSLGYRCVAERAELPRYAPRNP